MKKTLALLMSMALILSVVAGFAVSANAAPLEYVNRTYAMQDYMDEFGTHHTKDNMTPDTTYEGAYIKQEGYTFGDNTWTFEYWEPSEDGTTGTFKPMTAFFAEAQSGWVHGGWTNFYTSNAESAWTKNGMTYCSVRNNGKQLHPGDTAGVVVTYIVPADGVISYDLSIMLYGGENRSSTAGKGGDILALYVNTDRIWPAAGQPDCVVYSDTASDAEPFEVSVDSFRVKAGDKVRFMVRTDNGNNGSAGTNLVDFPVVSYSKCVLPIGDPKGVAPSVIYTDRAGKDTTDTVVTWEAAENAAGYNIYLKGPDDADFKKVNEAPITELTYTLTGLKGKTLYDLQITTIPQANPENESDRSATQTFMTGKGPETEEPTTPTTTDIPGAPASSDTAVKPSNTDNTKEEGGFPIWVIFVIAGVAVLAVVAVVVVVVLKKKPAAPAEAAAEEVPAEEPKE